MARYFLDSSALAKVYHVEPGTPKMVALLADTGSEFYISSLSVIEIQSVFSQKIRDGKITEADYTLLKQRFAADMQSKKIAVKNLLRSHQSAAERLLEKHAKVRRLRARRHSARGRFGIAKENRVRLLCLRRQASRDRRKIGRPADRES